MLKSHLVAIRSLMSAISTVLKSIKIQQLLNLKRLTKTAFTEYSVCVSDSMLSDHSFNCTAQSGEACEVWLWLMKVEPTGKKQQQVEF